MGDSVVETYPVPYSWPIQGWGADMPFYFANIAWRNDASGGQSTKSFIEQGWWALTIAANPAFVLIQLGSNDANTEPDHYTDPETTYRANLHQMVLDVRSVGGEPIFLTPLALRVPGPDGWHINRPNGLEPYTYAMIEQATEDGVGVIDLFDWSMNLYDSMGIPQAQALYGFTIPDGPYAGLPDVVHFSPWGADQCAQEIAAAMPAASPALTTYL
ncbi:MAG TPA: GDSL-type esterase/lipase family protein, partial [Myxococcota bacterium]|nr:GDSL-type esterase/lipase family protein [Myxococcota bacterium]